MNKYKFEMVLMAPLRVIMEKEIHIYKFEMVIMVPMEVNMKKEI